MKLLRFLVVGNTSPIITEVLNYLIDSGHKIFFVNEESGIASSFNSVDNIQIIKWDQVKDLHVDYCINTTTREVTLPQIIISTLKQKLNFSYKIYISNDNKLQLIQKNVIRIHKHELEFFLETVAKIFIQALIDTIIVLARSTSLNTDAHIIDNNNIENDLLIIEKNLLEKDRIETNLAKLYQDMTIFDINDLVKSNYFSHNIKSFTLSFDTQKISKADIECFVLSLLYNLHKNEEFLYKLDIVAEGFVFSKHFRVDQDNKYKQLIDKCNRNLLQITPSKFTIGYLLKQEFSRSSVAVIYDSDPLKLQNYSLGFKVNLEKGCIIVEYSKKMYFVDNIVEKIPYLLKDFLTFKTKDISLCALTHLYAKHWQDFMDIFNNTIKNYEIDNLITLWEQRVAAMPHSVALQCGSIKLSAQKLNTHANQLAYYLQSFINNKKEPRVAIYIQQGTVLLIKAILAILKAGASYVPLDYKFPSNRIKHILQDSSAALFLTDTFSLQNLDKEVIEYLSDTDNKVQMMVIDSETVIHNLVTLPTDNPPLFRQKIDPTYVIYTSGTTGKPKGTLVEHKSVTNNINAVADILDFSIKDTVLLVTSITFDISALEIFLPLLKCGTLVLTDKINVLETKKLIQLIRSCGVTIVQATPSLWQLLSQDLGDDKLDIKAICGGEALLLNLARKLSRQVKELWNAYGPTEATIWATLNKVTYENSMVVSIGQPLFNLSAVVLDKQGYILPVGAIGELCIGGICLAREYVNQPELTSAKFISDTHGVQTKKHFLRIYKTGDLARMLPSHNIEFIGRIDHQVKINGHRIELSEIENVIATIPEIKQCVVLVKSTNTSINDDNINESYIVAYYTSNKELENQYILKKICAYLPEYMLPNIFINVKEMPLLVSGKVNTKLLPEPNLNLKQVIYPQNSIEKRLYEIWAEELNIDTHLLSTEDSFFELGGNSILGIIIVNRLTNEFRADITIKDLFINKTIHNMAKKIKTSIGQSKYQQFMLLSNGDDKNLHVPFPMTNIQQTYYVGRLSNFGLGNTATSIYLEFSFSNLSVSRLEKALNILIVRHPALRTIFIQEQQQHLSHTAFYKIKISSKTTENIRTQLISKPYDPAEYPLFDIIITKKNNFYILHVSIDVLLACVYSLTMFFSEWAALYNDPKVILPEIKISYRDYILAFDKIRNSNIFEKHKKYWEQKEQDYNFQLNLPLKENPLNVKMPKFNRISRVLEKAKWDLIVKQALEHDISLTTIILVAYGSTLAFWSGQDNCSINLTLFNRLPLHKDVEKLIGKFTALSIFNYVDHGNIPLVKLFKMIQDELLHNLENDVFDGIDFLRMVRQKRNIAPDSNLSPAILTCILDNTAKRHIFDLKIDRGYEGISYSRSRSAQVWLENRAYVTEAGLWAEWDYVEQLFSLELIENMHNSYCQFLEQIADIDWVDILKPKIPLPRQQALMLKIINDIQQQKTEDNLLSSFERVVNDQQLSGNTAIVDVQQQQEFSYKTLYIQAIILAKHLCSYVLHEGQTAELKQGNTTLVAVLCDKSKNQILATISILKSGAAYLPLNVNWPDERIQEVINQSGVKFVVTSNKYSKRTKQLQKQLSTLITIINIDDVLANKTAINDHRFLPIINADDVAYVIFTSGSTGKPKGVTITHRSALNTILAINNNFSVNATDKILALSELSFDLSVYDIFGMLSVGGLIIVDSQENTKNPITWIKLITKYNITIWNSVPQLVSLLAEESKSNNLSLSSIRSYLLSGDKIPMDLSSQLKKISSNALVYALGGATEASIWSIWYDITLVKSDWNAIPYGVAMPNQKMYVLNSHCEQCPINVRGEIYIGGMGVALNYWNNSTLTNERFIHHPRFGKIYKTGDLGQWNTDGYIEFHGRNDLQVKINGYRVELEEISSYITNLFSQISNAVVKLDDYHGKKLLIAYIVLNYDTSKDIQRQEEAWTRNIKTVLALHLPSYMIPHGVMVMQYFPLSSNGKVDINKLPKLHLAKKSISVKPKNLLQEHLLRIWGTILQCSTEDICITESFFDQGGDSLLAMKLVSQINSDLQIKINLVDLYKFPSIENFSAQFIELWNSKNNN